MAEVNVEIDGRKYRMACEDGQEAHLQGLAERFNTQVLGFKQEFGEIGDIRLAVMAGIATMDSVAEIENRMRALQAEFEEQSKLVQQLSAENEALEARCTKQLNDAADDIERAAAALGAANAGAAH